MQEICAHTWEWGDYVPMAWDDWLADEQGALVVGDLGSRTVALSKITFLTADEVWLEGMRVDPTFRRKGIAERFLRHGLAYAREHGARVVRLGTGHQNLPIHRIAARAGMDCVGHYVLWVADPLPDGASPIILTPGHLVQVRRLLSASSVYPCGKRLYCVDWAWQELSEEKVRQLVRDGAVVAQCSTGGDILALATLHFDPDDKALWIGFSDQLSTLWSEGADTALADLAKAIRAYAHGMGATSVRSMLPDVAELRRAYGAAGFGFGDWEGELWIFELGLEDSPGDADVG